MSKKSIFYIMGIDWEWIYQRPQILAEKLAQDYQVTVLFPRSILKGKPKLLRSQGIKFRILWTIPKQEKNKFIGKISAILNRKSVADLNDFDCIYVGHPLYARYIPENYVGKIIYDCMDNYEFIYPDPKRVGKVLALERELVKSCDLLITTAITLQKKVDAIAGVNKSVLIRNGADVEDICEVKIPVVKNEYSLCYVGTISEWFDFNVVIKSLEKISNINYQMIGPAVKSVKHDKIFYHGAKPHNELKKIIKDFDCLIMPFQINEVVTAVDPVKLYEYIAFGKCIISVYYSEISRFEDYVYFYETLEEYIVLIEKLGACGFPPKFNREQQLQFLNDNTWDKRYNVLKSEID